jgi:hypothetical protein
MRKYARTQVLAAAVGRIPRVQGMRRTAHRVTFDYTPREGFLYVRSRAISSRTNDNYDHFPGDEIRQAYRTFIGKPVFVNHQNHNHRRARGVVIDAALHEDVLPDGGEDTWVEVLMEIDAVRFPKLAEAILAGKITTTSMGTDVAYSECSACGNRASTPLEYCRHIPNMKGQKIRRVMASGGAEEILVYERCYGLRFFENSVLVEEPADPTAFFTEVDDRGIGGGYEGNVPVMAKAASRRTASYTAEERALAVAFLGWFDGIVPKQDIARMLDDFDSRGITSDIIKRLDAAGPYGNGAHQDGIPLAEEIVGTTASRRTAGTGVMCSACGADLVVDRSAGVVRGTRPSNAVRGQHHDPGGPVEADLYGDDDLVQWECPLCEYPDSLAAYEASRRTEYPSLTRLQPGDRYTHERFGEVEVIEVRRARNNKGIQPYDSVKVRLPDGSTMITPTFSRPDEVRTASRRTAARASLTATMEYLPGPSISKIQKFKILWNTSPNPADWGGPVFVDAPFDPAEATAAVEAAGLRSVTEWEWISSFGGFRAHAEWDHQTVGSRRTADFDESRVNRANDGKFAPKGTGKAPRADKPAEPGSGSGASPSATTDAEAKPYVPKKPPTGTGTADDPIATDDVVAAAEALVEGKHVRLSQPKMVSTLVGHLADLVAEAKEAGEDFHVDLCRVSIKGTNIFCADNKGFARIDMPQLKSREALPGSKAEAVGKGDDGEYDIQPAFRAMLEERGISVTDGTELAANLKATQNELNGAKVSGMLRHLQSGGNLGEDAIFISNDDYIIDGHHRWASQLAHDAEDGVLGNSYDMPVQRIDLDIITLYHEAMQFAEEWGIPGIGAKASSLRITWAAARAFGIVALGAEASAAAFANWYTVRAPGVDMERALIHWERQHLAARRRLAYGETAAPPKVDTLRDDRCPVCGESSGWDGDKCSVCTFVKPPDEFMDPDLSVAQETDLRQQVDEIEDQATQGEDDGETVLPGEEDEDEGTGLNEPFRLEKPKEGDAVEDEVIEGEDPAVTQGDVVEETSADDDDEDPEEGPDDEDGSDDEDDDEPFKLKKRKKVKARRHKATGEYRFYREPLPDGSTAHITVTQGWYHGWTWEAGIPSNRSLYGSGKANTATEALADARRHLLLVQNDDLAMAASRRGSKIHKAARRLPREGRRAIRPTAVIGEGRK